MRWNSFHRNKADNSVFCISLKWWAEPGGSAIPGQPVAKAVQAPDTLPLSKNKFNIVGADDPHIRY